MMDTPRYSPPRTGIHICAFDDDEARSAKYHGPHITEASYAFSSEEDARTKFDSLRRDFAEEYTADLLVDLFINQSIIEDFWMYRQMLPRLMVAIAAPTPEPVR